MDPPANFQAHNRPPGPGNAPAAYPPQPQAAGQYYGGPMTGATPSALPPGHTYPGYAAAGPAPGAAGQNDSRHMGVHHSPPMPSTGSPRLRHSHSQPQPHAPPQAFATATALPPAAMPAGGVPLPKLHMPPSNVPGVTPPGVDGAQPGHYASAQQAPGGPFSAPVSTSGPPSFAPPSQGPPAGPGFSPQQPPPSSALPPSGNGFQAASPGGAPPPPMAMAMAGPPSSPQQPPAGNQPVSQRARYPQPPAAGQSLLQQAVYPSAESGRQGQMAQVAGQPGAAGHGAASAAPMAAPGPAQYYDLNQQPVQHPNQQPVHQPPMQAQQAARYPPTAQGGPPPPGATPPRQLYPPGAGHAAPAPGQYAQNPHQPPVGAVTQSMGNMQMVNQQQTQEAVNILAERTVLPPQPVPFPKPAGNDFRAVTMPNPDYVRSTLRVVPTTRQLLDTCRLPLGLLIQPFKQMPTTEVPLIRHLVMVRCTGCRAYFNPFVSFLNSHQWQCNLCFRTNEVPDSFYQADTRAENHRTRPELKCCAVEYLAPREYTTRPPPPAAYVFVIEATTISHRVGLVAAVSKILAKNFMSLPGDTRRQISIITYGRGVTFYAFKANAVQPQMYTVNDLEEICLPVPSGDLGVNIEEYQEMLVEFFEQLPAVHQDTTESDNCLGSAILAAFQLVTGIGGRVTVFQASMPNIGAGALKEADPATTKGPKLDASAGFYKEQSLEFNQNHAAVDVFGFGVQPLDLATTSGVCKFSSGQVYYYGDLEHPCVAQSGRFHRDLAHYLTRPIGFEAIMRLRCSYGVSIESFFGNFFHRGSDVLNMPNLNPDLTVGVQLTIEDTLPKKRPFITLQSAVLYTTHTGERRTRVTTIAIPTSANAMDVFDGADVEAVTLLVAKMATSSAPNSLADAREGIVTCVVDCLRSYQKNVAGRSPTMLLVPRSLSTLPLFFTGLLNLVSFSQSKSLLNDHRVYGLRLLDQLPVSQAMRYIYPCMYAVHDLGEEHTTSRENVLHYSPSRLQATMQCLSPSGIYLLDAGITFYVWIGQSVSSEVVMDLFDVESFAELPETQGYLPLLENPRSVAVNSFIKQLRKHSAVHAPLFIVRADSQSSHLVLQRLVDDGDHGLQDYSYYNFLSRLHKATTGK